MKGLKLKCKECGFEWLDSKSNECYKCGNTEVVVIQSISAVNRNKKYYIVLALFLIPLCFLLTIYSLKDNISDIIYKEYKHSFTLEVCLPDLLISLSDYSNNKDFREAISAAREAQNNSSDRFMDLFDTAWRAQVSGTENPTKLWRIFHNFEQRDLFPAKSSDLEIFDILASEAETAIDNTNSIISLRLEYYRSNFSFLERPSYSIEIDKSGHIIIQISDLEDVDYFRNYCFREAKLEFWETYFNDEVIGRISAANTAVGEVLNPELFGDEAPADSTLTQNQLQLKNPLFATFQMELTRRSAIVGYAQVSDTNRVNDVLNRPEALEALGANLRLLWDAKSIGNIATLYAIKDESGKGRADLTGSSIVDARVSYDEIGDVVVSMTMDSDGAKIWGKMTKKCSEENNRAVAVVLDNLVFSAPNVQSAITNGRSQISFGSQQSAEQKLVEAEYLSGLLKVGSLPAPIKILEEDSLIYD